MTGSWTDTREVRALLSKLGAEPPCKASVTQIYGATRDVQTRYTHRNPDVKALHKLRKSWVEGFADSERMHFDQITVDDAIDCALVNARVTKRMADEATASAVVCGRVSDQRRAA